MINENCGLAPFRATGARWQMHQCPMAGGNAVFAARALYALADKNTFFNNFTICEAAGYAMRKPEKTKSKSGANQIKIYPNPADRAATLEYALPNEENISFEIMTSAGQVLEITKLENSEGSYTFSIVKLAPGIYYYRVKSNIGIAGYGKLAIIR